METQNEEVKQITQAEPIKLAPVNDGSQIFGISARALIAISLVLTVCGLSAFKIPVTEPLNTLVTMVVGVYFGHTIGISQRK